jgi:hypothetical protein
VTGIVSQFTSSPFTQGYEIQPRLMSDITPDCPVRTEVTTWGRLKATYR